VLDYNKSIGDVPKLDAMLLAKYPFVNRIYSKTQRKEVTANTCIHCGSLQGNHFTGQSLLYIDNDSVEIKIDSILQFDFEQSDFDIDPGALEPDFTSKSGWESLPPHHRLNPLHSLNGILSHARARNKS